MDLAELTRRAEEVRSRFDAQARSQGCAPWKRAEIAQGLVGDVGDLMKLLMAKDGLRSATDLDAKLAHELADCLWSILVLARLCDVDLEQAFMKTMTEIAAKLPRRRAPGQRSKIQTPKPKVRKARAASAPRASGDRAY